jgi:hypothetical protein
MSKRPLVCAGDVDVEIVRRRSGRGILRPVRPVGIVLAALVVLAGAAGIGGSSAAVERDVAAPRIVLLDTEPATVRGAGFKSAERVQVAAFTGAKTMRRAATASSSGAFTMPMPGLDPNNCRGFAMTATGDKGSRATFKRAPGQCPELGSN